MKFDHIGIVVDDLAEGRKLIGEMFPIASFTPEIEDPEINVRITFATDSSGIRYELIAPLNDKSPLTAVLKSRKNILHHVAYSTPRFDEMTGVYSKLGLQLGTPVGAVAFQGRRVVFFMMPIGFIVELVEAAA